MPGVERRIMWLWCVVWGVLFLVTCLRTESVMFHHVSLDYNEGWNAQLASWAAGLGGHRLYSSEDGFIFNNYPPLSFVLVGAFVRLGCDAVFTGRVISCVSVLVSALLIAGIIYRVTKEKSVGLAAACLFLVTANTAFYTYVGMDDPQWLAQALMLSGLYVLLGRGGEALTIPRLFGVAALIALGGFTKHNLVALPLAIFVWLFYVEWQRAVIWAGMALTLVGVGFAVCYGMYGVAFFHDVFLHQRIIRWGCVAHGVRELPLMGGILLVGVWLFIQQKSAMARRDPALLMGLFLVGAVIFGELESLGEGVDYNCMFDALVAGVLLCGVGLARLLKQQERGKAFYYACWVVTIPLIILTPLRAVSFYKEVRDIGQNDHMWQQNIAALMPYKASLLCTDMTLCYWAGGYDAVDRFNLSEALKKGKVNFRVKDLIAQHKFMHIQMQGTVARYSSGNKVFDSWVKQAGYQPVSSTQGQMILLGYRPE